MAAHTIKLTEAQEKAAAYVSANHVDDLITGLVTRQADNGWIPMYERYKDYLLLAHAKADSKASGWLEEEIGG